MCINAYSRCGPRHRHSRDVLHVAQPPVHGERQPQQKARLGRVHTE